MNILAVALHLQLWDNGHRQAGRLHGRSVLGVPGRGLHQPHRVGGRMGGGKRRGVLDRPQLLGRALGESMVMENSFVRRLVKDLTV